MKKSIKQSKVLGFLLAALVAIAMWLYVITLVSPESEAEFHNIPVVLQGEAALSSKDRSGGLMLMMEEVPTVDPVLTGNRSDLNKLNASNITVTADLSKIYEEGTHEVRIDVAYPGDIPNGAISVARKDPATISVPIEKKVVDKAVDVVIFDGGTNVEDGYITQSIILDHEQIHITGPASVANKIEMARIDVNYTGRNATFREDYFITLCDKEGKPVDSKWIEVDHASVLLTAEIHQVKEVFLAVNVEDGGGATSATSQISIQPETIHVHGLREDLVGLDTLVIGSIKLAEYDADADLTFELVLPDNVEVMGDTQTVNVSLKFPELQIKEFTVKSFEMVGLPKNFRATILAKELKVRLRGPKDIVEQITEKNLKIELDMSDVKTGNSNVQAKVVIYGIEAADTGMLGTYQVPVAVTKLK